MVIVKVFLLCYLIKGHQADMTSASRFLVPFTSLFSFLGFSLCIRFIWFFTFYHFSYMYLIENMERVGVFTQFLLLYFTSFSLASQTNLIEGKLLAFDVGGAVH